MLIYAGEHTLALGERRVSLTGRLTGMRSILYGVPPDMVSTALGATVVLR